MDQHGKTYTNMHKETIIKEEAIKPTFEEWVKQFEKVLYIKVSDDFKPNNDILQEWYDQDLTPMQAYKQLIT